MKMKAYIQPATQEMAMQSTDMLATSPGVSTGSGLGDEYLEDDVTYSNEERTPWSTEW